MGRTFHSGRLTASRSLTSIARIFFASSHRDPFGSASELRIGSLEPGFEDHALVSSNAEGNVTNGVLMTMSGDDLVAYEFDDASSAVKQPGRTFGIRVLYDATTWKAGFSANNGQLLAYVPAGGGGGFDVLWKDRSGTNTLSGIPTGNYMKVEMNPEGSAAAFEVQYDKPNSDLWVADLVRGVRSRLGTTSNDEVNPVWSADGSVLYYGTNPAEEQPRAGTEQPAVGRGICNVYKRRADGAGGEEFVYRCDDAIDAFPWSVSPDGKWLLFAKGAYLEREVRELGLVSTEGGEATVFPGLEAGVNDAVFSPDGRWIAYCSKATGREEVHIVPFRPPSGKMEEAVKGRWQISYAGGRAPRWQPDGRELYYVRGDNTLMVVSIELKGDTVVAGREQELFQTPFREDAVSYDVTPDGQRFLVATLSSTSRKPFAIVSGWPSLLGQ